ncbi:hypothetical protein AGMMS49938_06550 [Fibrobacterales bacterium]|nr:hypothetical protein AGMMS49938_06550 [Fibrobacterales bacterium]
MTIHFLNASKSKVCIPDFRLCGNDEEDPIPTKLQFFNEKYFFYHIFQKKYIFPIVKRYNAIEAVNMCKAINRSYKQFINKLLTAPPPPRKKRANLV